MTVYHHNLYLLGMFAGGALGRTRYRLRASLTSPRRRLLPARGGTPDGLLRDGVANKVGHSEVARRLSEGQLGRPVGDDAEVRQGVAVQDAEKHLRDYAPADETSNLDANNLPYEPNVVE